MNAEALWDAFINKKPEYHNRTYEAWAYGSVPDTLAGLTLEGKKTATASLYPLYVCEKEPLPKVGALNVILNGKGEAVCVIETTKVRCVPFKEVDEEHALKEGEGDGSLAYWRSVHQEVFSMELKEIHQELTEDTMVVLVEFKVVFRA